MCVDEFGEYGTGPHPTVSHAMCRGGATISEDNDFRGIPPLTHTLKAKFNDSLTNFTDCRG